MTNEELLAIKNHAIKRLIFVVETVIMVSAIPRLAKFQLSKVVETARTIMNLTIEAPAPKKEFCNECFDHDLCEFYCDKGLIKK